MEQIGKKKCLEFGVFRPRLTSNPIQNANALQRLKNAFLHFSMLLPYSSFFLWRRMLSAPFFPFRPTPY